MGYEAPVRRRPCPPRQVPPPKARMRDGEHIREWGVSVVSGSWTGRLDAPRTGTEDTMLDRTTTQIAAPKTETAVFERLESNVRSYARSFSADGKCAVASRAIANPIAARATGWPVTR